MGIFPNIDLLPQKEICRGSSKDPEYVYIIFIAAFLTEIFAKYFFFGLWEIFPKRK
jgi:hypothetical protein